MLIIQRKTGPWWIFPVIEELGGVDNLVEWAKANQTEFYRMVARLMPREIDAKVSSQCTLLDALMEMNEHLKDEKDWMSLTLESSIQ